ncbi:MAG: ISL3 family transposase [Dehalococcoidia bacterium]
MCHDSTAAARFAGAGDQRGRLLDALRTDSGLAQAWGLKEALRQVYRKRSQKEAAAAPGRWIENAAESELRPSQRTASTLRKCRQEVLNYWYYPITNALFEGKHNRVKAPKRRAYGYRNDRSFLLRILNLTPTD